MKRRLAIFGAFLMVAVIAAGIGSAVAAFTMETEFTANFTVDVDEGPGLQVVSGTPVEFGSVVPGSASRTVQVEIRNVSDHDIADTVFEANLPTGVQLGVFTTGPISINSTGIAQLNIHVDHSAELGSFSIQIRVREAT